VWPRFWFNEVKMTLLAGKCKGGDSTARRVMLLVYIMVALMASCHGTSARSGGNGDSRRTAMPELLSLDTVSAAVQSTAAWAVNSGDNNDSSFVIVDKFAAMLYVYDADGTPRASTPVLLGEAPGDHSVPGIGARPIADIRPAERTTPAGRFIGEPGRNLDGENIVWIDYDAALAIHRLRPGPGYQQRLQRMASASPAGKRLSYGCVVVPVRFYEQVIAPTFARGKVAIYILPETAMSAATLFSLRRQ
jgi:hypothetical protein